MEYIFYPYCTNSDGLLIKICTTGLDLNEVDREFAKRVCYFDNHPPPGTYYFPLCHIATFLFMNTFRKINLIIPVFWPLILVY